MSFENLIIIDSSYFIFYRYYALLNWWKLAKPNDELLIPFENELFVEKFKKTFKNTILNLNKKLKLKNFKIIAALDCPRKEIWRNQIFKFYKSNREKEDNFLGGPFFKLGIDLLKNMNILCLSCSNLEADDCIALTCQYYNKNIKENSTSENLIKIYIIASDHDYLQLKNDNTYIFNLKFQEIKKSNDSKFDLFCKIITGDKSDNIPGIFKKCGPKTALKYFNDNDLFKKQLEKEDNENLFLQNKKIIDFNEIPNNLIEHFYSLNNLSSIF